MDIKKVKNMVKKEKSQPRGVMEKLREKSNP